MKLIIVRSPSTLSLDLIFYDKEKNTYLTPSGIHEAIEDNGFYIPFARLPYDTVIETDITEKDYQLLLNQKDKDKTKHIDNLNDILVKVLAKI